MAAVLAATKQHTALLNKVEISVVILALAVFSGLLVLLRRAHLKTVGRIGHGRCHARDGHDPGGHRHGHVGRWIKGNAAWAGRLSGGREGRAVAQATDMAGNGACRAQSISEAQPVSTVHPGWLIGSSSNRRLPSMQSMERSFSSSAMISFFLLL